MLRPLRNAVIHGGRAYPDPILMSSPLLRYGRKFMRRPALPVAPRAYTDVVRPRVGTEHAAIAHTVTRSPLEVRIFVK